MGDSRSYEYCPMCNQIYVEGTTCKNCGFYKVAEKSLFGKYIAPYIIGILAIVLFIKTIL